MNKKKKRNQERTQIRCPYCGSHAILRSADGIYRENLKGEMLYVCANYPECDSYVRVQNGTNLPLGTLANRKLRELRTEAHRNFDLLHKSGYITKQSAYDWLAGTLCIPNNRAHIGQFTELQCKYVIEESQKYLVREQKRRKMKREGTAA